MRVTPYGRVDCTCFVVLLQKSERKITNTKTELVSSCGMGEGVVVGPHGMGVAQSVVNGWIRKAQNIVYAATKHEVGNANDILQL